ncbi:Xan family putative trans-acting RiPP leader peptide [Pyxidicoccus fallax]|uniref:Xan family putative trans-acting RiPP leader peptide n=1 Tax=Pyxidicoccus fallax TaxID=394095 RepID=A0A848LVX6_9BACT|nr:Xan family putative trans-acting RiPP leader peptide [Pyxidicoccus fallax]NMO21434.1 Xan family putative trans-acting RiPP leader peptide [Pyxidicoccus fallax]NPC82589.1 Xan family putative trans-acting RiPP leader peptide [Pyxidicoccus fallax]
MASEELPSSSVTPAVSAVASPPAEPVAAPVSAAAPEKLDEIEEIDFLLEEIESKIAPLALA